MTFHIYDDLSTAEIGMCSITYIFQSQTFVSKFVNYTHTHTYIRAQAYSHISWIQKLVNMTIVLRYAVHKEVQSMTGSAEIIIITPNMPIPRTGYNSDFAVTKDY